MIHDFEPFKNIFLTANFSTTLCFYERSTSELYDTDLILLFDILKKIYTYGRKTHKNTTFGKIFKVLKIHIKFFMIVIFLDSRKHEQYEFKKF